MITPDDILLEELIELEAELKPKVRRLDELKTMMKDRGSFATDLHVCAVNEQTQRRLVSLDKAVAALGKDMLENFELIQTITFKTVKVSRKAIEADSLADLYVI